MPISLSWGLILVPSITFCAFKSMNQQFVFSLPPQPAPMLLIPSKYKRECVLAWGGRSLTEDGGPADQALLSSHSKPHVWSSGSVRPTKSNMNHSLLDSNFTLHGVKLIVGITDVGRSWDPPCSQCSLCMVWVGKWRPPGCGAKQGLAAGGSYHQPIFVPKEVQLWSQLPDTFQDMKFPWC